MPRLRRQGWPRGHPDLKGFDGTAGVFFWLSRAMRTPGCAYRFVAKSEAEVNAFYEAAMAAGATDNGKPGARLYYDPLYYAANVFDPTVTVSRRSTRAGNTANNRSLDLRWTYNHDLLHCHGPNTKPAANVS